MTILQSLTKVLAMQSAYEHVNMSYVDTKYPHSFFSSRVVSAIIKKVNTLFPKSSLFYIEAGCMYGNSLIKAFNAARKLTVNIEFVALDPFTGDVNMWVWEEKKTEENKFRFLHLEKGQPTIFERFLANTAKNNMQTSVVPLRTTSIVGFKLLLRLYKQNRIPYLPHIIYLDSAHERDETYNELKLAWDLLRCKGILFGDDWVWDAVKKDVLKFVHDFNITMANDFNLGHSQNEIVYVTRLGNQWILEKRC